MKGISSVLLLIVSNVFMTLAWYLHLQGKKYEFLQNKGVIFAIVFSWGLAFFEYLFQVPANRIGYIDHGGPFNLFQLKIIQEVITLTIFIIFSVYIFKTDKLQWNYVVGFVFMMLAVFFIFKKW
ncbi:MAG: hypothetical protein EAZ07_02810 [Cytophagales bacterium]|nr:MAG: hypothetical protein EAZ07_02810 [Cytophagales bacterium]